MDEISSKQLKTDCWQTTASQEKQKPELDYDSELDILYVYFVQIDEKERILTRNVDRNVRLLFRNSDREIVGMSIESFKEGFLPRYAKHGWRLMDTGMYLEGIRDIRFDIEPDEKARSGSLSKSLERNWKVDPIFA
jgi:hypothetical protein